MPTPVPPPPTVRVPESDGAKVKAPEELVMESPIVWPLVVWLEVAKVMAPVCAEPPPSCWMLVTPPAAPVIHDVPFVVKQDA